MNACRYPWVIVEPAGLDGSPASVIRRVCFSLRLGGAPAEDIERFRDEALRAAGIHDMIATCTRWVAFE